MLLALVRLKRIKLTQLALAFTSPAAPKSRYRRLQRLFQEVVFDYYAMAHLIMRLFDFRKKSFYLTLDRTNWKWGEKNLKAYPCRPVARQVIMPQAKWSMPDKYGLFFPADQNPAESIHPAVGAL